MTEQKAIKDWEEKNWFLAGVLQRECLSYKQYCDEVMDCISEECYLKSYDQNYNV